MTAIHTKIMQAIQRWGAKFESCKPAGDDAIVFKNGTSKVTVRYITDIDFYQVMVVATGVPTKNDIGVRENGLTKYFSAQEMAVAA